MALNLDPSIRPGFDFADAEESPAGSGIVIKRRSFPDNWPWPRVASKWVAEKVDEYLLEYIQKVEAELEKTKEELEAVKQDLADTKQDLANTKSTLSNVQSRLGNLESKVS